MKTLLLFALLSLEFAGMPGKKPVKLIQECLPHLEKAAQPGSYNLVMLSDSRCGYCRIALNELREFSGNPDLQVYVINYGPKEEQDLYQAQYGNAYQFVEMSECLNKEKPEFFPQFVLYNAAGKPVWQKKGWFKENTEIIRTKILSGAAK